MSQNLPLLLTSITGNGRLKDPFTLKDGECYKWIFGLKSSPDSVASLRTVFPCVYSFCRGFILDTGNLWCPSWFSEKLRPLSVHRSRAWDWRRPWNSDMLWLCIKYSKRRHREERQMDSVTGFISLSDNNKPASRVTYREKCLCLKHLPPLQPNAVYHTLREAPTAKTASSVNAFTLQFCCRTYL